MKSPHHAVVLCYNLSGRKALQIKTACVKLGVAVRTIQPEDYNLPLGQLLKRPEYADVQPTTQCPFSQEMLVFYQLTERQFDALLAQVRAAGGIRLKAVATQTNLGWSSCTLYHELCAEHAAIQNGFQQVHDPLSDSMK